MSDVTIPEDVKQRAIEIHLSERKAKGRTLGLTGYTVAIAKGILAERERWEDKVDGLEADLDSAIERLWAAGATTWVKLNYPKHFARYSEKTQAIRSSHD